MLRLFLTGMFLAASATSARADAILSAGMFASGGALPAIGVSIGRTFEDLFGFELDWARSPGSDSPSGRRITTFAGNLFGQSRLIGRRLRLYGTGGIGVYGETINDGGGSGAVAYGDIGGGMKIVLGGPLILRLDYRVLLLGDASDSSQGSVVRRPQRLSAGVGFAF